MFCWWFTYWVVQYSFSPFAPLLELIVGQNLFVNYKSRGHTAGLVNSNNHVEFRSCIVTSVPLDDAFTHNVSNLWWKWKLHFIPILVSICDRWVQGVFHSINLIEFLTFSFLIINFLVLNAYLLYYFLKFYDLKLLNGKLYMNLVGISPRATLSTLLLQGKDMPFDVELISSYRKFIYFCVIATWNYHVIICMLLATFLGRSARFKKKKKFKTLSIFFVIQIAKLQLLDTGGSELKWVEGFSIGNIIEGKIQEAKDIGVVVSFEKYHDVFGFITHYQCKFY